MEQSNFDQLKIARTNVAIDGNKNSDKSHH